MLKITPTVKEHHPAILDILKRTGAFTPDEIQIADELLNTYFDRGMESGYWTYTAATDKVAGYVCYGPTPLTEGTFDIYWIAVEPKLQGQKIGTELLLFAEDDIARHKGRLITVNTSSQEKYAPTRIFYDRRGYFERARIRNYYRPGDDLVIYVKQIAED